MKRRLILRLLDLVREILNNQEISATLNRYWEATVARDIDRSHQIYHDDVIIEFPQSGERISGKHNIYELSITLLNLVLKFCGYGEKEIFGYLKLLLPMMGVQSMQ